MTRKRKLGKRRCRRPLSLLPSQDTAQIPYLESLLGANVDFDFNRLLGPGLLLPLVCLSTEAFCGQCFLRLKHIRLWRRSRPGPEGGLGPAGGWISAAWDASPPPALPLAASPARPQHLMRQKRTFPREIGVTAPVIGWPQHLYFPGWDAPGSRTFPSPPSSHGATESQCTQPDPEQPSSYSLQEMDSIHQESSLYGSQEAGGRHGDQAEEEVPLLRAAEDREGCLASWQAGGMHFLLWVLDCAKRELLFLDGYLPFTQLPQHAGLRIRPLGPSHQELWGPLMLNETLQLLWDVLLLVQRSLGRFHPAPPPPSAVHTATGLCLAKIRVIFTW